MLISNPIILKHTSGLKWQAGLWLLGFQLGTAMLGAVQILYIQQFLYVLSLTLYSIDTEKKSPFWQSKKRRTVVLDYIKSSKIPNLQLFHLFMEKKNMKLLRMQKFSVMPEIFQ